jgi:hypothetical protein
LPQNADGLVYRLAPLQGVTSTPPKAPQALQGIDDEGGRKHDGIDGDDFARPSSEGICGQVKQRPHPLETLRALAADDEVELIAVVAVVAIRP